MAPLGRVGLAVHLHIIIVWGLLPLVGGFMVGRGGAVLRLRSRLWPELRSLLVSLCGRLWVGLLVGLLMCLRVRLSVCLGVFLWAGLWVQRGRVWQQIVVVRSNLLLLLLGRLHRLRLERLDWLDLLRYRLGLRKLLNLLYRLWYLLRDLLWYGLRDRLVHGLLEICHRGNGLLWQLTLLTSALMVV